MGLRVFQKDYFTHLFSFLRDLDNIHEVCFLHDKDLCFKANASQAMLWESAVDFFVNNPNVAEHLGNPQDAVESSMIAEHGADCY